MKITYFAAALALSGAVAAMPAHAVTFSESVSGDVDVATAAVDAFGQPTRNYIALDVGVNTFTGSINSPDDISDFIPFEVLAGDTVTSMTITLSNIQFQIDPPAEGDLEDGFGTVYYHTDNLGNVTKSLDLGANFYGLLLGNGLVGESYSVTFDVDGPANGGTPPAVPEPASWALMIGGMGLAGAALRKRTSLKATLTLA